MNPAANPSITYFVDPVLHELWMGAKGKSEINHLICFGNTLIRLGRLVRRSPPRNKKPGGSARSSDRQGRSIQEIQDNTMTSGSLCWQAKSVQPQLHWTSAPAREFRMSLILDFEMGINSFKIAKGGLL